MTVADLIRRYDPDLKDSSHDCEEVMRSLRRDARLVRVDEDELHSLGIIASQRPAEFSEALVTLIVELSKTG